jgi:hypothetical protein
VHRELRDVGAGDERVLARAAQDDDANLVVALQLVSHPRNLAPHFDGDRVAPLGVVEDDPPDPPVLLGPYPAAHGFPASPVRSCRIGLSDRSVVPVTL